MTFEDLIVKAQALPEPERVRELCALLCNVHAEAFGARGARDKSDGALACARGIRVSEGVEGLEAGIRLVASRMGSDEQ